MCQVFDADIHALRVSFGTHLSAAGVHPRTAMAAMRHSRMELTMNSYTDPVLLDVAGAVPETPILRFSIDRTLMIEYPLLWFAGLGESVARTARDPLGLVGAVALSRTVN